MFNSKKEGGVFGPSTLRKHNKDKFVLHNVMITCTDTGTLILNSAIMLRIVCSVKSMGQLHLYKGNRFALRGSYIPWSYYRYTNRNHHPHITVSTADQDPAWFDSSTIYCNAKGLSNRLETQYLYLHMSFYWVTAVSLRTNINSTLSYKKRI